MAKNSLTYFENWQINLELFCLQNAHGNEIYVQPRLLKLLSILHVNTTSVVHKDTIIAFVWDDVVIGEESLSKAVFDLRKFLKEHFTNPPAILTIRKVGYRLECKPVKPRNNLKKGVVKVLKTSVYTIGIAIILILVIRGLRYEQDCQMETTKLEQEN